MGNIYSVRSKGGYLNGTTLAYLRGDRVLMTQDNDKVTIQSIVI